MEDYAYILDYLSQGRATDTRFKREPIAYALGESELKMFELIPKPGVVLRPGDRVFIGKNVSERTQIQHVKRRISYKELTSAAQNELQFIVEKIVRTNPGKFIRFFNEAQPITTRFHTLELLPGLGKKTMWAIIEERKKGNFKDFEDLQSRVPLVRNVEKLLVQRIMKELTDPTEKYRLFVAK
jgi:putative nucleotide binding protein